MCTLRTWTCTRTCTCTCTHTDAHTAGRRRLVYDASGGLGASVRIAMAIFH